MPSPWSALEMVVGLTTYRSDWHSLAGDHFPALKQLCLKDSTLQPEEYPCPKNCGCWHRILRRFDGTGAVAACHCDPPTCPDFPASHYWQGGPTAKWCSPPGTQPRP
jgi:hypothetical protein